MRTAFLSYLCQLDLQQNRNVFVKHPIRFPELYPLYSYQQKQDRPLYEKKYK